MKILKIIRFKIAYFLDRSERFCWADLALFGMGYNLRRLFKTGGNACLEESKAHDCKTCYCGKFYDGRKSTAKDFENINNGPEKDKK